MSRPETPKMSLATTESFIWASSSSFSTRFFSLPWSDTNAIRAQTWASLTFTDEHRPDPADPVAPARRPKGADAKAATKTTTEDLPATSFTALLGHIGTLTRNHLRVAGHDESGFDLLAIPPPPNAEPSNSWTPRSHSL
jgi:hypothetical protein